MIVEDYPPLIGGGGLFVQEISRRLSPSNSLTVVTSSYGVSAGRKDEKGILVIRFGRRRWSFFLKALWSLINSSAYDVYHSHGALCGTVGKTISVLKSGKSLLHLHGFRDRGVIGPIKYFGQVLAIKMGHAKIMSVDGTSSRKISSLGIPLDKIVTFPSGVDTHAFQRAKSREGSQKVFLYAGRLTRIKDIPTLVKAAERFEKRPTAAEFWLAGKGEEEKRLRAAVAAKGLKNVRFLGAVPHAQMSSLLQRVDCLILPSLTEAYPLIVLEAFACGLPAIVSDCPSLRRIIQESGAGFVFGRGNEAELISAVDQYLSLEPAKLEEMKRKACLFAEQHSWERIAAAISQVYLDITHAD